jgi:hypothetical protein
MATLSGNVNRARVIVFHQHDHLPVSDVQPDINGDWSATVPDDEPMMVIYITENCRPVIHGPYWGAV